MTTLNDAFNVFGKAIQEPDRPLAYLGAFIGGTFQIKVATNPNLAYVRNVQTGISFAVPHGNRVNLETTDQFVLIELTYDSKAIYGLAPVTAGAIQESDPNGGVNVAVMIGATPSVGGKKGLVPPSDAGGETTEFLRKDGDWAVPGITATVNTTDATQTTLATIATTTDKTYSVETIVTARRTGGVAGTAGDSAGYRLFGVFKNIGGTLTQIGSTDQVAREDQAGWDADFDVSGTSIRVRVTGAIDNNVSWDAMTQTRSV